MFAPILCLALALPSDPSQLSAAELSTRLFDLAPILQPRSHGTTAVDVMPVGINPRSNGVGAEEMEAENLSGDAAIDLMRNVVWPEEWEFEGRAVDLVSTDSGTYARVTAPTARMADVERFLAFLAGAVNAETAVTLDVYPIRAATGSIATSIPSDAAAVAELVRGGQLAAPRSFQVKLVPGRVERVALTQTHTYLSHFEVEIAQAAARVQPIARMFDTGTVAALRADVMPDGRVALRFAVADSAMIGEPRTIDLNTEAQFVSERGAESISARCVLQDPDVRFATVAGTAELQRGESIVVGAIDPNAAGAEYGGVVVVLRVDQVPAAAPTFTCGKRELRLVNVAFGGIGALLIPTADRTTLGIWSSGADGEVPLRSVDIAPFGSATLVEGAINSATAAEGLNVSAAGPFISIIGEAGTAGDGGATQSVAESMLAALPRPAPSCMFDVAQSHGNDARVIGRVACGSEGALAVAGSQENYVVGYEVDVANNSSIAQPVTLMLPSAWAARVTSASAAQNGHRVRVQFLGHVRGGAKTIINPQLPMLGIMHGVEFLESAVDATRTIDGAGSAAFGLVELSRGSPAALTLQSR